MYMDLMENGHFLIPNSYLVDVNSFDSDSVEIIDLRNDVV